MVTSWYDTQQCRSGLHKSGAKQQGHEGSIIWTAARPPDRDEGPKWTAAATRPAVVVQRKPPVPRVRNAARPAAADRPAALDPEPEGAADEPDPTAELKRLAEENAELRRQLAASAKGGDA